ncbi:acid phosphatase [Caulobacter sp. D4A]|nr:acid phosphatase [Caulobacter sp. D4A]PXA90798.1 acid phosphatase [Caulobacter sp. D5]
MMRFSSALPFSAAISVAGLLAGCAQLTGDASPKSPAQTQAKTYAEAGGSSTWTKPPKGYLTLAEPFDAPGIVGPPPTPDSPRGKADRAAYDDTRKLAGTPAWDKAVADADLSGANGFKSFSCAARVTINPQKTPTLANLLLRMTDDAGTIYRPAKQAFSRPRPPVGNTKPICVPRESWIQTEGSYPSGHALVGWSWGLVLAELVPDRAAQITARGREFGDSRVICGVHFPSDLEAGRLLGGVMVARLHADPAFEADLEKARAEIAASKAEGPPTGCGG